MPQMSVLGRVYNCHPRPHSQPHCDISVEDFLQAQDELLYQTGIHKMHKRWHKCNEVYGDYVDK